MENDLNYQKIDSFRQRFDFKYSRSNILQMTLIPPFQFEKNGLRGLRDFLEMSSDELESHLLGFFEDIHIPFNGFDFKSGKKGVLYLKPSLPIDLYHCQESLFEILKETHGTIRKYKKLNVSQIDDLQTFLPIGRFIDPFQLELAVDQAKIEFDSQFIMRAKDITLFEKMPGKWIPQKVLFKFSNYRQEKFKEDIFSRV